MERIETAGEMTCMQLNELISLHYREFTDNELIVCRHLLSNLDDCARMTVDEVAQACHVSHALVTRFAKKLGFSGFSELKAYLRLEAPLRAAPARSLIAHASGSYRHIIDSMLEHDFSDMFSHLLAAERVIFHSLNRWPNLGHRSNNRIKGTRTSTFDLK